MYVVEDYDGVLLEQGGGVELLYEGAVCHEDYSAVGVGGGIEAYSVGDFSVVAAELLGYSFGDGDGCDFAW